jgi:hypothetical protein
MASQTKTQPNSGFNRRLFLAGAAAGGAMLPVTAARAAPAKKKRGIYADAKNTPKNDLEDKVADFSYQSDVLAQLVVDMWTGSHANLITPAGTGTTEAQYQQRSSYAKAALAARGIYLEKPIVITEEEYEQGFNLLDGGLTVEDGVVFVLPRNTRATTFGAPPLLETAKMLMAITPNGI